MTPLVWLGAEIVDLEVDRAYRAGGVEAGHHELAHNDTLEHLLSELGAQLAYLHTGDRRMYDRPADL